MTYVEKDYLENNPLIIENDFTIELFLNAYSIIVVGRSRWGGGSGGGGGGRGRGGSVRGRFTASAGPKSFSSYGSSSSAPSYGSSVNGSGAASYQRNSYSATGGTGSSSSYGSPYGQWQPVTSAGATGGKF